MKSRYPLFVVLGLAGLLLTGCFTPRVVIRMQPGESENVFWSNGQAIAEQVQDSVIARAAFSHATPEYLIFDIEVINQSGSSILVAPEKLFIATPQNFQLPAIDPERQLLSMEISASQQEARAKNAAVATGVIAAGAIIAVAATSDGDSGNEDDYDDDYDVVDAAVDVAVPALYLGAAFRQEAILSSPISAIPLPFDAIFWSDYTLRKTTLRPDDSVRGLVAFSRFDQTDRFALTLPLEELKFKFSFEQVLIQPR